MQELSANVCNTVLDFTAHSKTAYQGDAMQGETWESYVDWKKIHIQYGYKWALVDGQIYEIYKHGLRNPRPYDPNLTYFISDYLEDKP